MANKKYFLVGPKLKELYEISDLKQVIKEFTTEQLYSLHMAGHCFIKFRKKKIDKWSIGVSNFNSYLLSFLKEIDADKLNDHITLLATIKSKRQARKYLK